MSVRTSRSRAPRKSGWHKVKGGITAPKGYLAAGVSSGIKEKDLDKAWGLANRAVVDHNVEDAFMFYYQMAIIRALENEWRDALRFMGFMIYYNNRKYGIGLGGATHRKFAQRLLKRFNRESSIDRYELLAMKTEPRDLQGRLDEMLN